MVKLWNITVMLQFCTFRSLSLGFICTPIKRLSPTAFLPVPNTVYNNAFESRADISKPVGVLEGMNDNGDGIEAGDTFMKKVATFSLVLSIIFGSGMNAAIADTPASTAAQYDGFADYAKENQMEKSDVACFANKCGDQTKALFSNPRGIKGVSWYVTFISYVNIF